MFELDVNILFQEVNALFEMQSDNDLSFCYILVSKVANLIVYDYNNKVMINK